MSNQGPSPQTTQESTELTQWLETVPLCKQKINLTRDFSDGVLMAKLIAHHFPKMIELHSYVPANGAALKMHNWELLNRKVFPKLGIKLPAGTIDAICHSRQGIIEPILGQIKKLISKKNEEDHLEKHGGGDAEPPILEKVSCLAHILPDQDKADYVIFHGVKFVPETLLEEEQRKGVETKSKIRELSNKVSRLETLINLKETHLGDLTKQVHEFKKLEETKSDSVF